MADALMPDLELGPDEYRKRDPQTGRWLQNVDRRFCFWMGVMSLVVLGIFIWRASIEAPDRPWLVLVGAIFGFGAGGMFTLSLRRPDW